MKYTKQTYPIQQLPTGEILSIHAYTFTGSQKRPKIYLQANLHGPEIFGTTLLEKCITYLESQEDISGSVTIVPTANPIAVQHTSYNALTGRYNPMTGTDWNRIFKVNSKNIEELGEQKYYTKQAKKHGQTIEDKLANTLRSISAGSSHILDIHTAGSNSVPHVFPYAKNWEVFLPLQAEAYLLWDEKNTMGTFDDSHITHWHEHNPNPPATCAWEVYHHGKNDLAVCEQRWKQLKTWLESVWEDQEKKETQPLVYSIQQLHNLPAPIAGYYTWLVKPGTTVKQGEIYASVYQPWHHKTIKLTHDKDFYLLGNYGIDAMKEGEWIAMIIEL
ncbi:succinylglutamate desuccinylase/aspartoacylase family protein [Patescibacteria group bacterium]|nr:succinylglutamate desuccinylase/aspartoacylase family protein [Patescibacteria group bacterium]MBU1721999.1 succinylglutamate desuccinylase/aspartoacylase family protein [Patescibacteria group bacterium]MBU1901251.1 succinylglutamate desuccinylase/aspartoacylase family protein [Patescibacteria group bacterium]